MKGGLLYERAVAADDKLSSDYRASRRCDFTDPVGDLKTDCRNSRPFTSWMSFVATATLLLRNNLETLLSGLEGEVDIYDLRQKLFDSVESGTHNLQIYGQSLANISFVNSTLAKGYQVIEFQKEHSNSSEILRGRVSFNQSEKDLSAALDDTLKNHVREIGGANPCSADCPPGSYISLISHSPGLSKCWICKKCAGSTVSSEVNSNECVKCAEKELAWNNNTACKAVPENFILPGSPEFIVGFSLSVLAGAIKITTAVLVLKYRSRPVIKASDCVFCYLFLLSLCLGDLLTVVTLLEPSTLVCNLEFNICTLFVCCTCYNLFYRSLKIYNIFMAAENFQRRPSFFFFLSRRAQFVILFILIGVTVLLTQISIMNKGGWLYEEALIPHKCMYKLCIAPRFLPIFYPFILPSLMLIGTLFLAYKMRLFPHNFKETTTIFNTCLIIVMICLIFLSGYNISEPSIKSLLRAIIYFCVTQTFLLCVFLPKILVLLQNEDLVNAGRGSSIT